MAGVTSQPVSSPQSRRPDHRPLIPQGGSSLLSKQWYWDDVLGLHYLIGARTLRQDLETTEGLELKNLELRS